jgi:hypothetical protein
MNTPPVPLRKQGSRAARESLSNPRPLLSQGHGATTGTPA